MFYQIAVTEENRTYLRFFWYQGNDPNKHIVEYWSNVHVMGHKSSPAIAGYGVQYAARKDPPKNGTTWIKEDDLLDPIQFNRTREQDPIEKILSKQFYVDDLMASTESPETSLNLLEEGTRRFGRYEMKLCKIQSNCSEVLQAFPDSQELPKVVDWSQGRIFLKMLAVLKVSNI